ncbi:MAG: ATP-binding protein, partial [Pseudomonadales bacterium]|nr:ATP-binding protein [Pseudomonadales bacterium]
SSGKKKKKKHFTILIILLGLILLITLLTIAINRSLKRKIDEKTKDLQSLNANLEDIVAHRTEELQTAKEKALRLADAKTEFTTNVSHEIRTPLNAVIGLSELALRSSDPRKQWDYLKKINTSAKALLQIINDILDLSKIEAGKLETHIEAFNLHDFTAELNDIFRYAAESKGLEFTIDQTELSNSFIMSDPTRLKQVFVNLIGNAIKFTHQGAIKLSIHTTQRDSKHYLGACIEDTGIGIEKADLEKLFNPFQQADNSIARQFGGTGLGLSICKKLTDLLEGEIRAESEPGEGSKFFISIPIEIADDQQLATVQLRSQHSNQVPVFSGIQALIIEDQPLNREVIIGILAECNIQCQEADNGFRGIEMSQTQQFDIIFLDIQMPGLDGFQTLEKLRDASAHEAEIVIAMTAHAQPGYDSYCLERGFTGYISKPIDALEVYQTLTEHFKPDIFKNAYDRPEDKAPTPASEPINEFDEALIDIKSGIKRLRGKEDRYQSLLKDFISRQPNLVQRLTEHVGRNDTKAAKDFAHEMKGSTGNLSLDSLHYCLEDLEQALINNDLKETHQKLVDLGRAWRITEREVKKYLGTP